MKPAKRVIFTAGTGRSGTTSITHFFRANVRGCIAEHEAPPVTSGRLQRFKNFIRGRESYAFHDQGFGDALVWYDVDDPRLDSVIRKKAERIRKMDCEVYLEANHSFLKSTCDGLVREFPDMSLIHLSRDPLEVAKSFANRAGPQASGFGSWNPLPTFRKNCLRVEHDQLSVIQLYLWMWIEVELRFVRFTDNHPHVPYIELDTRDLNDATVMKQALASLELECQAESLTIPAPRNTNDVPTELTDGDLAQASAFLKSIPSETLSRLRRPYRLFELRDS